MRSFCLLLLQLGLIALAACGDGERRLDLGDGLDSGVQFDFAVDAAGIDAAGIDAGVEAGAEDGSVQLDPMPGVLEGLTLYLSGADIIDSSIDQGGGIWAVTSGRVYYYPPGRTEPFSYDQSNGFARGWTTWTDTYFEPGVRPVTFSAVAGGIAGEAVLGNIGAIADRVRVDPGSGAVLRIDNMEVTASQVKGSELLEHQKRVVAVWSVVADTQGTLQGSAYLGGFHGFYAFHGLSADCGCLPFEEHQHFIDDVLVAGGDVRALALTSEGDLWAGDRQVVQFLPQRSQGERIGFFDFPVAVGIDVWPGTRDEVWGLAIDDSGGVYVASIENGLAYLDSASHTPTQVALPERALTSVAIDGDGDLWIGTQAAGVLRLRPSTGALQSYRDELPSSHVRRVQIDRFSPTRRLLFSTANGLAVYTGL
jgi:hypothetical protein